MRKALLRFALLAVAVLPLASCHFYSVATHWNGRLGPDGKPVYYATVSKVGLNLLIIIPFLGHTTADAMVDEVTAEIAKHDGDIVRIVQAGSENYWYGWSPFTWIITPVVAEIAVDFQPSAESLERNRKKQEAEQAEANSD